jgi:hypothetical protein
VRLLRAVADQLGLTVAPEILTGIYRNESRAILVRALRGKVAGAS